MQLLDLLSTMVRLARRAHPITSMTATPLTQQKKSPEVDSLSSKAEDFDWKSEIYFDPDVTKELLNQVYEA